MGDSPNSSKQKISWPGLLIATGLSIAGGAFLWTMLTGQKSVPGISPGAIYATRLPDGDGNSLSLGQWQGKILVVNFWATWCEPCKQEIPQLVAAQNKYGKAGLQVIGVAVDEKKRVAQFLQSVGVNYPILLDESGGIDLSKRFGNRAGILPFTVVIDRKGQITTVITGALTVTQIDVLLPKLI